MIRSSSRVPEVQPPGTPRAAAAGHRPTRIPDSVALVPRYDRRAGDGPDRTVAHWATVRRDPATVFTIPGRGLARPGRRAVP
eukprot:719490-Hanusia_phi.AAC.5